MSAMDVSESDIQNSYDDSYINELVKKNRIVIFSKTWCPYCKKAEELFKENNLDFTPIYLDTLDADRGSRLQQRLKDKTSQSTVPNIFINGNHLGGCSDLQLAFANGIIHDILENRIESYEYDLVVIGGGSGGLAAAKEAANLNKKVAVIDYVEPSPKGSKWGLGGTCVNVGCIPKKLMHRAALIYEDIQDAQYFGWNISVAQDQHDWQKMVESVQCHIKSLNWKYRKQLKDKKVNYINEFATLKNPHTLSLKKKEGEPTREITATNFIISVGGRPLYPEFPGAKEYCITSDDLFSLKENPGKTLIIGASYIALECAGFLSNLNIDCTVMVRSILLRGFDQFMAEKIRQVLGKKNIKFLNRCVPLKVVEAGNSLYEVTGLFEDKSEYKDTFKTIILATGRMASTTKLNLESVGVKTNTKNCKIIVDDWDRTSVKTIFAIGDVVDGKPELTPVAIQAGKLLVQRLYNLSSIKMEWKYIPTTIFTPLEYGCVGLSEDEALASSGNEPVVYHSSFQPLEKVLNSSGNNCYAKLVCLPGPQKELKVVGLHVLSPNAGEIVQGFALALKLGVTKKEFDCLVGIHPTCAEVFTSMFVTKSSGESDDASC